MEELKKIIAKNIKETLNIDIDYTDILDKIEIPKDNKNGDFAYPCFNLAKLLKNSPINIANSIKDNIKLDKKIDRIEVVNGYLNFYANTQNASKEILSEIVSKKEEFATFTDGSGKKVLVDYSSPNIAKPFHLGHLMTTLIGAAICNLNKELRI